MTSKERIRKERVGRELHFLQICNPAYFTLCSPLDHNTVGPLLIVLIPPEYECL